MVKSFLFISAHFEKWLKICLILLFVMLLVSQFLMFIEAEFQVLVNKALRTEGVFQSVQLEDFFTLQHF